MKRRVVPNTVSKRFRRKLRRARNPYYLWLRCKRPRVWARLTRLWNYRFMEMICSIPPYATPFFSAAVKVERGELLERWRTDEA